MKAKKFSGLANLGLGALCLALVTGGADAKPDKGKGNDKGKGGSPGHSEKGNKGGKHDDKGGSPGHADKGSKNDDKGGKSDDKSQGKAEKEFRKDIEKDRKEFEKRDKVSDKWNGKGFRDKDYDVVTDYFDGYRDNDRGLPPGLAKNVRRGKPLPPGWQKKLSSGRVIEDDLFEFFDPLSYDLFPGIQVVPDTRLYRYGDRIVRVYEPRREVIDFFRVPTIVID